MKANKLKLLLVTIRKYKLHRTGFRVEICLHRLNITTFEERKKVTDPKIIEVFQKFCDLDLLQLRLDLWFHSLLFGSNSTINLADQFYFSIDEIKK